MSAPAIDQGTYSKPYLNGRVYFIDGVKVPSVTSILGKAYPKPALTTWAAKTVANHAIDHWRDLSRLSLSERLEKLSKAPWSQNSEGTAKGTELHKYADKLLSGADPATLSVTDRTRGCAKGLAAFLSDFGMNMLAVEAQAFNRREGYAGTFDWLGRLPDGRTVLGDFKTNKSGIFPETAVQLTAYKYCQFTLATDDTELPMLPVDETWGVHLRDDGTYAVYPMQSDDEVFEFFLHLKSVAEVLAHEGQFKGNSITPEWV